MKNIYASLDLGSSNVKLIVAEVINSNIHILFSKKIPSKGIRKGMIVDEEAVQNDIRSIINDANEDLKAPITSVLLNIPAIQCQLYSAQASCKILSDDGIITVEDVLKALKKASKFEKRSTEYVVTCIPIQYRYDNITTVKVPIGKKASSMLVDALVITSLKSVFYPYIQVVENAGLQIMDVCINSYAGAKEVFDEVLLYDGAILIDIGHETSTVSYYENGFLQFISVEQGGSYDLSKKIAMDWRITADKAESLKVKYGSCRINSNDQDIVAVVGEKKAQKIYRKSDLANELIIGVEELMKKINSKLSHVGSLEGKEIVITGGGGELEGIEDVASEVLGVPVRTYRPDVIGARDMAYVNNLGLIYFLLDREILYGKFASSVVIPDLSNTVVLGLKGLTKTENANKLKSMIDKLVVDGEDEE